MFQIGDWRVLIAYLGLLSDLLCKAAKEGQGVVRSTSSQICSDVDPTTPSAPRKLRGILLMAQPPLLCQGGQGGEFCLTSCVSRRTCGTRSLLNFAQPPFEKTALAVVGDQREGSCVAFRCFFRRSDAAQQI